MILCTISQFHCTQAITLDMIDNYQLDEQEVAFLQLVYAYHHRENDNQLWHMKCYSFGDFKNFAIPTKRESIER